jgi:hypothetical protein
LPMRSTARQRLQFEQMSGKPTRPFNRRPSFVDRGAELPSAGGVGAKTVSSCGTADAVGWRCPIGAGACAMTPFQPALTRSIPRAVIATDSAIAHSLVSKPLDRSKPKNFGPGNLFRICDRKGRMVCRRQSEGLAHGRPRARELACYAGGIRPNGP